MLQRLSACRRGEATAGWVAGMAVADGGDSAFFLVDAVREAKAYVAGAMHPGIPLGGGHRPLNHFWKLY